MPEAKTKAARLTLQVTEAGRNETARRGIIPGRRQCRGCGRSGGELTENGCPSCGPSADIGIVASAPNPTCTKCGGALTPCAACGKPAQCGDSWCAECTPDGGFTTTGSNTSEDGRG